MAALVYAVVRHGTVMVAQRFTHFSCGTDRLKVNIRTSLGFITVIKVQLSSQAMTFKRITLVAS
jgi:hypothetical protein